MRNKGTNEYDPLRHQMVSLDSSYLLFGHGRHAWSVELIFCPTTID